MWQTGLDSPIEVLNNMELTVRKSDLLKELQLFQGIIERKNTIPISANVLIDATEDGTVGLTATDLEVGFKSQCDATVKKKGSLTLPAKKLYEIIRALPETDVKLALNAKGSVKISADQFNSRLQTLPVEDFPSVPSSGSSTRVTLPREEMRLMVANTIFAITGEDTRYFLNGALFVLKADEMNLIATDGHRLALATTKRTGDEKEEIKAILPKKLLTELSKLLSDGEDEIQYECGENHLFFYVDKRQLCSRLIEGQFPAYEKVIPTGNKKSIDFDRDRLTSAIKRVALLSNERSRAVKFQLSENAVTVTSNSPEVGEADETIDVDYKGEALEICFNSQYILEFLAVVDTDSVALQLKDEMSQAVMQPVGAKNDYTYVIMPMRV